MKKIILLTMLSMHLYFSSFSQGIWTQRTSLPDSARGAGIGFSIGNYGYAGLGTVSGYINSFCLNDFWQFNPASNSWARKADFPGSARICPATFVIGKYGYVVTGQRSDSSPPGYTNECWQYNSSTDSWTLKANFPGIARGYDIGFSIGGKGYVGLGSQYYKYYSKDFWEYDTTTDSWTRLADFGGTSRICAAGYSLIGSGYVCFGCDSNGAAHIDMWKYDTGINTWTQKTNYPGPINCWASGFIIQNNIYVGVGTNDAGTFYNQFWQYNPLTDTWAGVATFIGMRRAASSSFAIGDTGYLGLGIEEYGFGLDDFYKFNLDSLTGLNIMSGEEMITVYPNPFMTSCTLTFPASASVIKPILKLFDATGKLYEPNEEITGNTMTIKRGNMPEGIYFLFLNVNSKIITKKLIILN